MSARERLALYELCMIYHYTSFETFQKILPLQTTVREILIHATCAYDMDDKIEMQLGYDFVRSFLISYEEVQGIPVERRLSPMMPPCNCQITTDNQNVFFQPRDYTPFVISFTKSFDDDYMWNHYGENHKGVFMAFDELEILQISINSERGVVYSTAYETLDNNDRFLFQAMADFMDKRLKEFYVLYPFFFHQHYRDILKREIINQFCTLIGAGLKVKSYKPENEVRWVSVENSECDKVLLKRGRNGKEVHFIEEHFPLSCIKAIYVGRECSITDTELNAYRSIYDFDLIMCQNK